MPITNKHDLPALWYEAVKKFDAKYSKGGAHYSATEILNSPRQVLLKQRHRGEVSEDCIDATWRIFGKLVHQILEGVDIAGSISEERFKITVLDRVLSGQIDQYADRIITDVKVTNTWAVMLSDDRVKEWGEQLNIYADMMRQAGYEVDGLRVLAIYRNWSEIEKIRDAKGKYPKTQVEVIDLELWAPEFAKEWIQDKIMVLVANENVDSLELPSCRKAEMWEKDNVFAVKKKGRKSALRCLASHDKAANYISIHKDAKDLFIEFRPGERIRCERFCNVNKFCNQYAHYQHEKASNEKAREANNS